VEAREADLQERHRIVDEIHDTAKQKLDAANIWIHNSKPLMNQQPEETENPLQLAEDLMEAASDELEYAMRLLAGEFSKESAWESSPIPLPEALQKLVSLYARLGNFREQVQIHGEPQPMPRATEETLKRIAREALFNIVKHAQAQMVQVTLQYEPQEVLLSIADDGRGMRPKGRAGFGLQSMNKRAQEIKGTFQVESAPDQGTRIEVRVPIRGE
jgi:signal transduction histidine kinase